MFKNLGCSSHFNHQTSVIYDRYLTDYIFSLKKWNIFLPASEVGGVNWVRLSLEEAEETFLVCFQSSLCGRKEVTGLIIYG